MTDLRHGRLAALAHVEGRAISYRITKEYWLEDASVVSLQGQMFDISPGQSFAAELEGAAVVVAEDAAIAWLGQHGIRNTDPAFPNCLRPLPPSGPSPRKPQYQKQAFLDEAVNRLHNYGALDGRGSQANFEEEMRVWYEDNLGKPPSKSTIRNYVREAINRFNSETEMGLGN